MSIWKSSILSPSVPLGATATILAKSHSDPSICFQITDWTSPSTKKAFEESENYESVKQAYYKLLDMSNPQLEVHYVVLPGTSATPGGCKVFALSVVDVLKPEQDKAGKVFSDYLSNVVEKEKLHQLLAVGPSARQEGKIVSMAGFNTVDDMTKLRNVEGYHTQTQDLGKLIQGERGEERVFQVTNRMDFDGSGGRIETPT